MEKDHYKIFKEKVYSLFPQINMEEWEAFRDIFIPKKIRKKTLLCEEGKPAKELYFINKGSLRLFYPVDGEERTVFYAFENQFTGPCRSFMLNEPNIQLFETTETTELLTVCREPFIKVLSEFPRLALLRSSIAEENLFNTERIVSFLLLNSPEERYISLLKNNPAVFQRLPQHMIASLIGVSPVSLSRIKKRIFMKK